MFGTIVSRQDVEQAVIAHLQRWIPTYIAEVERQAGLTPQTIPLPPDSVNSYRGGIDFDTYEQAWCPQLTVVAQANSDLERYPGGEYTQAFRIQVSALVVSGDEDDARALADRYGAGVMAALLQQGSLGTTWIEKTILTDYPVTSFPIDTERRMVQSLVGIESIVSSVVSESEGPKTPADNPYLPPPEPGTVIETDTTVAHL